MHQCLYMFKAALLCLLAEAVRGRTIFVIEMSRNGAAAPEKFYPWDEGKWDVGPGELTPAGMRQQYLVGAEMRNNYITSSNNSIMTSNLSTSQVYSSVTDSSRMLNSAEAQLLGLYPPGTGPVLTDAQVLQADPPISISNIAQLKQALGNKALPFLASAIPIHGEITNSSALLRPFDGGCPKVTEYNSRLLNSEGVANILQKYPDTLQELENLLGYNSTQVQAELYDLYSSFEANTFAGNDMNLPADLVPRFSAMWQEVVSWLLSQSDDMNRLAGSPFLQELMWQFYGVMGNVCCYTRKFSLYVTNGYTILMVLATLGKSNFALPPFASMLRFEVIEQTPFTDPQYFVQVTLNNETIHIPTCADVVCHFDVFMKYVTFRSYPDAETQCALADSTDMGNMTEPSSGELKNDEVDDRYHWTLWFALALIAAVCISGALLVWVKFKRSQKLLPNRNSAGLNASDFRLSYR